MSTTLIVIFALKAFAVVMFAMNLGVILTWVDRRQGSMIQDRVGPNRAAIPVPAKALQVGLVVPALAVVAGILYLLLGTADAERTDQVAYEAWLNSMASRALMFSQLAIFATWLTALVIAGRVRVRGAQNSFDGFLKSIGDPRRIFYAGLALHVLVLAAFLALEPTDLAPQLYRIGYGSGSALLIFAILFGAGYAAFMLRNEGIVRVRLLGLLHPAADGLKTAFKEDFIPPNADRFLHSLAPFISFFPVLVVLAVVPFGDTLCFTLDEFGDLDKLLDQVPRYGVCAAGAVDLQVVDLNVGILYFFALAGTGIVGAALAGWASDNKFSLLGGLRAASQMVSYEVTLGLTVIGALMIYGTVRVDEMVRWQAEHAWGIFVQPLAFFLFFAASVAESKRIPFDLPEGESEIVAGYFTEYSGMKFSMFFFAEYVAVVTGSVLMAALFLGGWHLPFLHRDGIEIAIGGTLFFEQALSHGFVVLLGALGFVFKVILLCWVQLTIRWTLPRFRYDQLMRLGWRKLLPASLANILATGLVVLAIQSAGAAVQRGLNVAADLSMAALALLGLGLSIWFTLFLLKPVHKRRLVVTSSAKYAEKRGGTRWAKMEA